MTETESPRLVFASGGLVTSDTPRGAQDQSHVAAQTLEAARLRWLAAQASESNSAHRNSLMAEAAGLDAEGFMPIKFRNPTATAGGELPLTLGPDDPGGSFDRAMIATVRNPDLVQASSDVRRLRNAQDTGSLEFALDIATELRARSNLERMIIQAMTACYNGANQLQAAALYHVGNGGGHEQHRDNEYRKKSPLFDAMQAHNAEAARLSNAAARQWASFYLGVQTLAQLRRGGKQKIVVQYVNVADGGQAVVAQSVKGARGRPARGGKGARGRNQNARQTP